VTPHIVHIVHRFDTGGMENGMVNLFNALPPQRFRHSVVALSTDRPSSRCSRTRSKARLSLATWSLTTCRWLIRLHCHTSRRCPLFDLSLAWRTCRDSPPMVTVERLSPTFVHTRCCRSIMKFCELMSSAS